MKNFICALCQNKKLKLKKQNPESDQQHLSTYRSPFNYIFLYLPDRTSFCLKNLSSSYYFIDLIPLCIYLKGVVWFSIIENVYTGTYYIAVLLSNNIGNVHSSPSTCEAYTSGIKFTCEIICFSFPEPIRDFLVVSFTAGHFFFLVDFSMKAQPSEGSQCMWKSQFILSILHLPKV